MWIPTPIYERLPQFWLLLGLLFMASGVFLGFDYWLSFVYFFVGFACCGWSAWTMAMRVKNRQAPEAQAEQTENQEPAPSAADNQPQEPLASV